MKQIGQNINSKKNLKKIDSNAILIFKTVNILEVLVLDTKELQPEKFVLTPLLLATKKSISDPSYAEQIINFTFPHIGNVGTNKEDHEVR